MRNRVLLIFQTLIVFTLLFFDNQSVVVILLVLVATQLPLLFSRYHSFIFILTISTIHFFLKFDGDFTHTFFSVLIFTTLQIFGFSVIETLLREEKAKEKLAEINQELLATRFMLKESYQRKERLRISRDLHDVIGHQLTALTLNLEVATHKVTDEFKPLLQQNLKHAKALLTNVREVVKEMRSEEQFDLIDSLQDLVKQLPHCQLKVKNKPIINSLTLKQQLMFCLKEGISNALRHGKANQFNLIFLQNSNKLNIELIDNGSSDKTIVFGSGLNGMQERLFDFNGSVLLVSKLSGSTLTIQVEDSYD
ncbi:MAG: histidine kinase [Colwellia sp.]